ncbi:MAG: glycerol-3-phosphate 1-O-acyltransferase [Candidatus Dadabacteria bacterium]|nr:MAG: glycerol-3-phosphate 1-O-acyltransferase [Candidatus Dadabacteria bacterium]
MRARRARTGHRSLARSRRPLTPSPGTLTATLFAAWLIGTVPTAWLAVRILRGQDLRNIGSGNIGATNAGRVLGRSGFLVVATVDAAKGAGATLLVSYVAPDLAAWGGTLAVVGHCWPPWLAFAGGKGVASLLGSVAVLSPLTAVASIVIWCLVAAWARIASVASLCAVGVIGAIQLVQGTTEHRAALLTACLIVFLQHRDNLTRLRTGDEPRLGQQRKSHRTS